MYTYTRDRGEYIAVSCYRTRQRKEKLLTKLAVFLGVLFGFLGIMLYIMLFTAR